MDNVHKETSLVFGAPAELVASDCRRLAAQLLFLVLLYIQGKSMDMCEWPAFFFSIDFCSASTSLRFSEAPRKLELQIPPLSSPFTDMFHLQPTL